MDGHRNVLIFGDTEGRRLSPMTLELIRVGAALARRMSGEVSLLFLGGEMAGSIGEGYGYGVDRVFAISDPLLGNYAPEAYVQVLERMAAELKAAFILFGQTDRGTDLAPRLAFKLKTAAALDCIDLSIDSEARGATYTKPVFGGKAHAVFSTSALPLVASVRQGSFAPAEYDPARQGEVVSLDPSLDTGLVRTKFLRRIEDEGLSLAAALTSAPLVVSGGRGLKAKEGVDLLKETAGLIGAALGGSRPAIDNGWLPSHLQVGLTGKRINPQLYMAIGISGSLQHMAGCMKSKTIVAINSDESAPIFKMAHIGVVGDFREVLEGFNDEMKERKGKGGS